ncbi:outer membrane protein [Bradyrhizobium sp.]|uniref:outer membrane protein n=1 Tax=Bradyrhizobium sp. TaxID=376 RepID=UPI003C7182D5
MRGLLLAAMMLGAVTGAQAADLSDLPILRGGFSDGLTSSRVNWAGVYIGGQATHGAADMDFTNSGQDLLAKLLNNLDLESQFNISKWPLLGKAHMQSSGFGGFVGYNFQWSEALIGLELNYTRGNFFGASSGSQSRAFFFPTDYFTTADVSSSSSIKITDFGSLRVRGGYAIGSFLPYGFVGVAMGRADINRRADATLQYTYVGSAVPPKPNIGPVTYTLTDNANAHFLTGFAAGLGLDLMLYANIFLRAEWEYLRFTSTVDTSVNTVRAGVGYKF